MARIAGVDLPNEKRVEYGLTYVYGIGVKSSNKILAEARREDLWTSQIYIYKPISINFFSLGIIIRKTSGFILLIY